MNGKKMWQGRFTETSNRLIEAFNNSINFDKRLVRYDIKGSIAHVKMLCKIGVLTTAEKEQIITELEAIKDAPFEFQQNDEDVHMAVERILTDRIGPLGGKLHTGRSRNDQVALDMHLYTKHVVLGLINDLQLLCESMLTKADEHIDVIMPGYTHLQRAQPVRFSHHLLCYINMFKRDITKLQHLYEEVDISPLGCGAIAGSTFALDRQYVAKELGLARVYSNSMDGVSNRDFVAHTMFICSMIMMHLSRLSEELVLWCSHEFNFIELSDAVSTGSSMMPQKKNPDVPELVRGKTGRVYGNLLGFLTTLKGLPLTYNKDMQEDKEGFFDTIDTTKTCINVTTVIIENIFVTSKMQEAIDSDFSVATDVADYLAQKGLPFREAHEVTGQIVKYCLEHHILIKDINFEIFRRFSSLFERDIYNFIKPLNVVDRRQTEGGTARCQVEKQLKDMVIYFNELTEKKSKMSH